MRDAHDRGLALVLHIEDNPGDAVLVREAFEQALVACQLEHAADGEAAREFLETAKARVRLVLLDLNLPRRSGLEILHEIKSNRALRTLPVIVLTSSRAVKDVEAAYGLHCNAYLGKPSTFDDYVRLARSIGDFWLGAVLPPVAAHA